MHILAASILDVSNAFQNTNVPIHERVFVSPPPYYLDWFKRSYPYIPLNRDDGTFCIQCMNVIEGKNPAGRQWNRLLNAVVTMIKYRKRNIIILSTSNCSLMSQCPILQSLLIMFSILPIMRQNFLD